MICGGICRYRRGPDGLGRVSNSAASGRLPGEEGLDEGDEQHERKRVEGRKYEGRHHRRREDDGVGSQVGKDPEIELHQSRPEVLSSSGWFIRVKLPYSPTVQNSSSIQSIHAIGSRHLGGAEAFFARLLRGLNDQGYPSLAIVRSGSPLEHQLSDVLPLCCPSCGASMSIIAFTTDRSSASIPLLDDVRIVPAE